MMTFEDLYLIHKEKLVRWLFFAGLLIAYLGSLYPWFMWPVIKVYPVVVVLLFGSAYYVSLTMEESPFNRHDFLLPTIACAALLMYERVINEGTFFGYITSVLNILTFLFFFIIDKKLLLDGMTLVAKVMAVLLAISLAGHFLYLIGIPLPSRNAEFGEFYSFTNYYIFLLDDRNIFAIIPRFNSYFLEPGHIGTATAFLLFFQYGQWRKWYNIILLAALFFTFSLAAYVFLVVIIFLNLWIQGKQFMKKLTVTISALSLFAVGVFFYNGGDNMVYNLIMLRLEVSDGEMAGDNRVNTDFKSEFESYMESSDILTGREMDTTTFGNSGYRVYIYENGLIGLFFLTIFYIVAFAYGPDKKAVLAALFLALLYFIVTAFMLWYNIFLPLYMTPFRKEVETGNTPITDNPTFS